VQKRFEELPEILKPSPDKNSQIRCPKCNKMFGKGKVPLDPVEIKCPRCGEVTVFSRLN